MKKISLFVVLSYLSEFSLFVLLVSIFGTMPEEDSILLIAGIFITIIYLNRGLYRAKKTDLSIQAKLKSPLIDPKSAAKGMGICTIIPFVTHMALDLSPIGDILVCSIVAFFIFRNREVGRVLTLVTFTETVAYKVSLDKGDIVLVVKCRPKYPKIDVDDTLELSHISGNYYLLKNVIKKDRQNDNIEENKLLEA